VVHLTRFVTPTEVDHYQVQRVIDIYVSPVGEDLGKLGTSINHLIAGAKLPGEVRITVRGMVQAMRESFESFGLGLSLAAILLYLILVAQFSSFKDPLQIMLAVPMGFIGVMIVLPLTGTTLNVMSLMGVLMLVGIAASNSILIVEFAHRLEQEGRSLEDAIITSCRVRLRPILMTSLATMIGLAPMALKPARAANNTRRWRAPSSAAWRPPSCSRFSLCRRDTSLPIAATAGHRECVNRGLDHRPRPPTSA